MSLVDIVVVTGAGRGIGKAIALELGSKNIPVLCISKSNNAEITAEDICARGGKAESLKVDLIDYKNTESVIKDWASKTSYKRFGVVLAAAILGPKGPLTDCDLSLWDDSHKANILGNLAVLKSCLPTMLKNKFGRIITFAGGGAAYANPAFPAYSATKTATVRITENIYEDLQGKGDFLIVCLGPGAVETDMLMEFRSGGGQVKTTTNINEPVSFVSEFMNAKMCSFSGRFVHIRNEWREHINSDKILENDIWKLRRIE